jgi:hypothetical protein
MQHVGITGKPLHVGQPKLFELVKAMLPAVGSAVEIDAKYAVEVFFKEGHSS